MRLNVEYEMVQIYLGEVVKDDFVIGHIMFNFGAGVAF
jgi:hypothetical protein